MHVLERLRAAQNPETAVDQFRNFTEACEPNASVRIAAAKNPTLDQATLLAMTIDSDEYVRRAIFSRSDVSAEVLHELGSVDEDSIVRRLVASHPKTFVNTLIQLSADKDELVRAAVGGNPLTPQDILVFMSKREDVPLNKDKNVQVRYAVAKNPQCPASIRASLLLDPAGYVADAAKRYGNDV